MSTLVYVQGLSHRGFRVQDNTGAWKTCKKGVTIQVDLDADKTKKILSREKANFIRVAASNSTTASIVALSRRGFRIKNTTPATVLVKHGIGVNGQTPVTVDLTKGETLKLLKRNKGAAWVTASGPTLAIRGLFAKQIGFDIRQNTQATAVLTSDTTNVSNGDTVTVGSKVYTFQTALTNVDGNVLIGANAAASLANLAAAATLGAGSGTTYAAATTANTAISNAVATSTTVTFTASETTQPGTKGNSLASTETSTHLSFGGATFSGGADAATANPTKVYEGVTVTVDTRVPFNFQQLRRHHKAWVEA